MNSKHYEQYVAFKEKQTELAVMLDEASEIIKDLSMSSAEEKLKKLSEKVYNESFKVQVIGTFKNGKSTFINSLLGEEVLPARVLPCTAVVNELKWGDEKRAVVHFRDPLPEKLSAAIPAEAMSYMKKHNMKSVPPLEIPYNEIEKYAVVSLNQGKEEFDYESPYEKIELFWPLPLLKNGVEIADTPGLNECKTRSDVTNNYLHKADAILFLLNALGILSASEMRVIETTIKKQGFEDSFIVVNKFDAVREREREDMRRYVKDKLDGYTTNEFFFISALDALDGKLDGDEELLKSSGVPELEKALSDYLTSKKGRAKLSQPTRELKRILTEEALFNIIPTQRAALLLPLEALKKKHDKAKPALESLRIQKIQLFDNMMLKIEQSKYDFKRIMDKNFDELSNCIQTWVDEYEPRNQLGIVSDSKKISAVAGEIAEYINEKIEDCQLEWRNRVLESAIKDKAAELFGSSEAIAEGIFRELEHINSELTGYENGAERSSVWQRIDGISSINGMESHGAELYGDADEIARELAKTATIDIGGAALSSIFATLTPPNIFASLIQMLVRIWPGQQAKALKKLKSDIIDVVQKQIYDNKGSISARLVDDVSSKFTKIAENTVGAVDNAINDTENQIRVIIAEMEKGKESIERHEAVIHECEDKIKSLSIRLDDLINRLMNV